MVFRYLFHQVLSLTLSPILRTTIFFTDVIHSTVVGTCNLMQDLLDENNTNSNGDASLLADMALNHNSDLIGDHFDGCVSTCTQTVKRPVPSTRNKKPENTEVVIHNMNSSKKLIIIQKDLAVAKRKKRVNCENCKSEARSRLLKKEEKPLKNNSFERTSLNNKYSSDSSNMSLENDVRNAQIEYSQNISARNCIVSPIIPTNNDEPAFTRENSRILNENLKPKTSRIFEFREDAHSHLQKTSSPIEQKEEQSRIYHWNASPKHQVNQNIKEFSDFYNALQDVRVNNPSILEVTQEQQFCRRRSLPSNFNTKGNKSFHQIHDRLLGKAMNSSYKKKSADLKFPIPLDVCVADRRSDEGNDSRRDIFSSSSYESLPVSDNIRTEAGKSFLFSSRKSSSDNVNSNSSSVNELVEAFTKVKDELSVSNAVLNKISADFRNSNDGNNVENRILSSSRVSSVFSVKDELERKHSEKSTCEMQGDSVDKQIISETIPDSDENNIPCFNEVSPIEIELRTLRVISKGSASSSPPRPTVCEAVETMLFSETLSDNDENKIPYYNEVTPRQIELQTNRVISNGSANSSSNRPTVPEVVETMLKELVTNLN